MNRVDFEPVKGRHVRERGAALIMVLVLVAILAVIVISYLVMMRIQLRSSHAFSNSRKANAFSQSAINHGIELLRHNIPDPARIDETSASAPDEAWFVNPGQLSVYDGGEFRRIPLHTGAVETDPASERFPDADSVDLNRPSNGFPLICYGLDEKGEPDTGAIPEMRVRWHNVLRDPSRGPSKDNPIAGRYAFWIDDESGKINFNVASGKPSQNSELGDRFREEYDTGMMPPRFEFGTRGGGSTDPKQWGLGKVRSINLDVLGRNSSDIDREALYEQTSRNGFFRYPEAITAFLRVDDPGDWYHREKYHFTAYSRSPEFNVFGRPRMVTTRMPLSLEGGPSYQLPFQAGSGTDSILHLHNLMGEIGLSQGYAGNRANSPQKQSAATVNRARIEEIMGYLRRPWPGYDRSFVDKYGEAECYQIALNFLAMGRMATSFRDDTRNTAGSHQWGLHSTDLLQLPPRGEMARAFPERHYWRFEVDGEEKLMIPQQPGPYITDVRVIFTAIPAQERGIPAPPNICFLQYQYEVEYYVPRFGPQVHISMFPVLLDYLELEVRGGQTIQRKMGPPEPGLQIAARDWMLPNSVGEVIAWSPFNARMYGRPGVQIAPSNRAMNNTSSFDRLQQLAVPNRFVVRTQPQHWAFHLLSTRDHSVPRNFNQIATFDLNESDLEIDFKIRLGMTAMTENLYPTRPRQMIPLGETADDTLQGSVSLSLFGDREAAVSFSILDPRLSGDKSRWIADEEGRSIAGPFQGADGTAVEPGEDSSEKSKMRAHSRGGAAIQSVENEDVFFELNRPGELDSTSVVTQPGIFSMIHTGMQSGNPWRTLHLGPESEDPLGGPPDYLLLDLLAPTHPVEHDQWMDEGSVPDSYSAVSYQHSTAGQINLNSRVYPANPYFQAPERKKPIRAVFHHLRSEKRVDDLLDGISEFQKSGRGFSHVGQLAEVSGYHPLTGFQGGAPTDFEKEELLRNMSGCLTTQSNTYGLWGVAQVVQTTPKGLGADPASYGKMSGNDGVMAERRFYALIERYIWEGKDGLPGNGHPGSNGIWDRVASPRIDPAGATGNPDRLFNLPGSPAQVRHYFHRNTLMLNTQGTHPIFDGPEEVRMAPEFSRVLGNVEWERSSLEDAFNPPQPVVKYRIVYLRFFDS